MSKLSCAVSGALLLALGVVGTLSFYRPHQPPVVFQVSSPPVTVLVPAQEPPAVVVQAPTAVAAPAPAPSPSVSTPAVTAEAPQPAISAPQAVPAPTVPPTPSTTVPGLLEGLLACVNNLLGLKSCPS